MHVPRQGAEVNLHDKIPYNPYPIKSRSNDLTYHVRYVIKPPHICFVPRCGLSIATLVWGCVRGGAISDAGCVRLDQAPASRRVRQRQVFLFAAARTLATTLFTGRDDGSPSHSPASPPLRAFPLRDFFRVPSPFCSSTRPCRIQHHRHQPNLRRRRQFRRDLQKRFHRTVQSRQHDGQHLRLVGAVRFFHRRYLATDEYQRRACTRTVFLGSARRRIERRESTNAGRDRHNCNVRNCRQSRAGEQQQRAERALPDWKRHR